MIRGSPKTTGLEEPVPGVVRFRMNQTEPVRNCEEDKDLSRNPQCGTNYVEYSETIPFGFARSSKIHALLPSSAGKIILNGATQSVVGKGRDEQRVPFSNLLDDTLTFRCASALAIRLTLRLTLRLAQTPAIRMTKTKRSI